MGQDDDDDTRKRLPAETANPPDTVIPVGKPSLRNALFGRTIARKTADVARYSAETMDALADRQEARNRLDEAHGRNALIPKKLDLEEAKLDKELAEAKGAKADAEAIAQARQTEQLERATRRANIATATRKRSEQLLAAIDETEQELKDTKSEVERTRLKIALQRLTNDLKNLQRDAALIDGDDQGPQSAAAGSAASTDFVASLRQMLNDRPQEPGVEHRTFGEIHTNLQWHINVADSPPVTAEDWLALAEKLQASGEYDWLDKPRLHTYIRIMNELIESGRVKTAS